MATDQYCYSNKHMATSGRKAILPKPYKGRTSRLTEEMKISIHKRLEEKSDSTLEDLIIDLNLPIKKTRLSDWLTQAGYIHNPIELCWSKIKSIFRKFKPRTSEALLTVLKDAMDMVAKTDIAGWFKHCGYSMCDTNACIQ